jgi:hypothetical protein
LVGRQFLTQYPSDMEDQRARCFAKSRAWPSWKTTRRNNSYILFMWENVKSSGAIQPWIVVLLSLEAAAALGFGLYFFFRFPREQSAPQETAGRSAERRTRESPQTDAGEQIV